MSTLTGLPSIEVRTRSWREARRLGSKAYDGAARGIAQARQRHLPGRRERALARVVDADGPDRIVAELDAIDLGVVLGREDRDGVRGRQRDERATTGRADGHLPDARAELDRLEEPRRGRVDDVDALRRASRRRRRRRGRAGATAARRSRGSAPRRCARRGPASAGEQRDGEALPVERQRVGDVLRRARRARHERLLGRRARRRSASARRTARAGRPRRSSKATCTRR